MKYLTKHNLLFFYLLLTNFALLGLKITNYTNTQFGLASYKKHSGLLSESVELITWLKLYPNGIYVLNCNQNGLIFYDADRYSSDFIEEAELYKVEPIPGKDFTKMKACRITEDQDFYLFIDESDNSVISRIVKKNLASLELNQKRPDILELRGYSKKKVASICLAFLGLLIMRNYLNSEYL